MGDFSQIHWMQVVLMEYHNSPLRTFVTQTDWIYVLCEAISSLPAKACILTQFSQFILWLKMAAAAPSDSAEPRRACDLAWFWDIPKDPKRPGKNKWLQYNEHFKEAKFGDISMYSQFFVESFANSMQFPHFSSLCGEISRLPTPKGAKAAGELKEMISLLTWTLQWWKVCRVEKWELRPITFNVWLYGCRHFAFFHFWVKMAAWLPLAFAQVRQLTIN